MDIRQQTANGNGGEWKAARGRARKTCGGTRYLTRSCRLHLAKQVLHHRHRPGAPPPTAAATSIKHTCHPAAAIVLAATRVGCDVRVQTAYQAFSCLGLFIRNVVTPLSVDVTISGSLPPAADARHRSPAAPSGRRQATVASTDAILRCTRVVSKFCRNKHVCDTHLAMLDYSPSQILNGNRVEMP